MVVFLLAAMAWGQKPTPQESDYVLRDFQFKSGEKIPEVRMHYLTYGKPEKDGRGGR